MRPLRRLLWVMLLGAAAAAAARPLEAPAAARPPRHAVIIDNMRFTPASLEISVGETVVWINQDDRDHTVVARDESFISDNIKPGAKFSHKFSKPGRFPYTCAYHPRMRGLITVAEPEN